MVGLDYERAQAVQAAELALACASSDPGQGTSLGTAALLLSRQAGSVLAESIAEQSLGLAARLQGRVPLAIQHLRRAVGIAHKSGLTTQAARAAVTLSPALQMAGRTRRGVAVLESAIGQLHGLDRARAMTQLAGMHKIAGNYSETVLLLRKALPVLRRHGDVVWQARALGFRAEVHVERGHYRAADADYRRAGELCAAVGHDVMVAGMLHNRGWSAAYSGDVPAALDHYDDAERMFRLLGLDLGELVLDRADLLLFAGLASEALHIADQAAEALIVHGDRRGYPHALLTGSAAALAVGDTGAAHSRAEQARREFREQHRSGWTAIAGYAAVRARWGSSDFSPRALQLACQSAEELVTAKLFGPALDVRLIAGRTALAMGRRAAARRELSLVSTARRRGTAEQRSRGWLAEALLRQDNGQRTSALRALRAGLDVIDRHRATLGASELRAHASGHATDLATLGQRLAIESRRPASVLEWTERWRGAALRLPPVRPPDDRELAADLAALREATTDLEKAAAEGEPTGALNRKRAGLEESVLRRTRRTSGSEIEGDRIATPAALAAALRSHALVEIAAIDERIYGVTLVDGTLRLHDLGDVSTVVSELDGLRFALRRLAFARTSSASSDAAKTSVRHAGARLDDLLIAPMLHVLGDRPLVVVPPGGLHTLPWSVLPSCTDRDVTIAPSATTWLRCALSRPPRSKRVVLVAGPELPGADSEVASLGHQHPGSTVLAGTDATAAAVSKAIDGAALAHIAAHGHFRSDNPLFSSLRLFDGPLTVYDLERLRRAPYRMVLSSCDSGLAGVRAGDELMGLAAALFPLGTAGIVASVVPVPDHATYPLMVALHERLIAGDTLSQALAAARSALDAGDPAQFAAGAAFVALGAH